MFIQRSDRENISSHKPMDREDWTGDKSRFPDCGLKAGLEKQAVEFMFTSGSSPGCDTSVFVCPVLMTSC